MLRFKGDADGNGTINTASVVLIDLPAVGVATVQSNGKIRYVAPAGFLGQIAFSYTVADNLQFLSNTALVTVDIVGASYQNPRNRFDVDDDGSVSPLDVLVVINTLNLRGIRLLGPTDFGPPFIDVNGDNSVDPIDVLQVINYINRRSQPLDSEGEGEGEAAKSVPTTFTIPAIRHAVDRAWSVPDYFSIRKRAKITDAAFMELGDDLY